MNKSFSTAISFLEKAVTNPSKGLPEEVFFYVSRITPLVNVDLLLKDQENRTLLSWRSDQYCGQGWHVPGGIIRFKETLEDRINKVAENEIGASIEFDPKPIALNQVIDGELVTRGHFISILYRCYLISSFEPKNAGLVEGDPGYLRWYSSCPDNLLKNQHFYREYI